MITHLTRDGRRVAAVVPVDIAESVLRQPPGGDDDDHPLAAGPRRTLAELCREQDVWPVEDPGEPRGEELPDFDEFFAEAMSARSR
jgi:hypothetical protein